MGIYCHTLLLIDEGKNRNHYMLAHTVFHDISTDTYKLVEVEKQTYNVIFAMGKHRIREK